MKRRKGNTLIEFVLVFPVVVMLMMGLIDYSMLFYDWGVLQNAATKAARYGTVKGNPNYVTTSAVTTFATNLCTSYLISFKTPAPTVSVAITQTETTPKTGDFLTVTLTYNYARLSYVSHLGFSTTYTLTAKSVMRYE